MHNHATNLRSPGNSAFGAMVGRWGQQEYIQQKWGVSMAGMVDYQFCTPYKHPFNNPNIWHSDSWRIDPKHRECIRTGKGQPCHYNVAVTKALEKSEPQPRSHVAPPKAPLKRKASKLEKLLARRGVWTLLASEGSQFTLDSETAAASSVVQFVFDGWTEIFTSQDELDCSQGPFKHDPAPGVRKVCQVWDAAQNGWGAPVDEGAKVKTSNAAGGVEARVRFGAEVAHRLELKPGTYECNSALFGGDDPAPGKPKRCEVFVPS
jgi:hypothetical protein